MYTILSDFYGRHLARSANKLLTDKQLSYELTEFLKPNILK